MYDNKKVILHLVFDGVLFDKVYPSFESMDNYTNRYLLGSLGVNKQFKHIRNREAIIRVDTIEEWGNIISDPEVDYIYLHGLWQDYLKAFDYIRNDVVVMWWCFGMEIYEECLGWPPLLPIKLYKPRTHLYYLKSMGILGAIHAELRYSCPTMYTFLRKAYNQLFRKPDDNLKLFASLLSRIDYAFTPLAIELSELKRKHHFIKARPFRLVTNSVNNESLVIHNQSGCILLEHSASLTNNHLDIISILKKKKVDMAGRDIYIPLSYGKQELAKRVKEEAVFEGTKVHCLMDSLSYEDYSEMISGCTHAFFGMIRQSGLGNINLCFRKGIKVFFFKDSLLYKHFRSRGFHVFSIEDDLDIKSLYEPLPQEQAQSNYDKSLSIYSSESFQQQFDNIFNS